MTDRPALLLAAFPPELAGLGDRPPRGWQVACTGIGAVTAAAATAGLLHELRPDRVLFVGTCGAYDARCPLGTPVWAAEALAVSLDEREGRAYRPDLEVARWSATLPPLPFPAHTVAVPPGITRTLAGARRLAEVAAVEHLELTGVYAACQQAGVPCGAVLAVANRVGPDAHAEWRAHHAQASRDLRTALEGLGLFA